MNRAPIISSTENRPGKRQGNAGGWLLSYAVLAALAFVAGATAQGAELPTGESRFEVKLPPPPFPEKLMPGSPFGINMAVSPDVPDLAARLKAMQQAGIKWGRQDFTWSRIEREPGQYQWEPYDRLVETCRQHGILLFGNLAYAPAFHDPRTPQGAAAYAAFAAAAARHLQGKVDHWQIWNEPNGGFWKGTPEQYAALLAAAGKAIHEANPKAKVLGLNMAFCDLLWAEKILKQVPYECFDIACFHPYRPPSSPEDRFDWWVQDQYVKSWHRHDLTPEYPMIRKKSESRPDLPSLPSPYDDNLEALRLDRDADAVPSSVRDAG
ncbi:MAG: hypothetical protein WCI75_17945, partial [candidate division NC10 bacterium]